MVLRIKTHIEQLKVLNGACRMHKHKLKIDWFKRMRDNFGNFFSNILISIVVYLAYIYENQECVHIWLA